MSSRMRTRGGLEQLSAKLEPKLEPVAPKREPAVIKSEPRVKTEFKKEEKEQESSAGEEDDGMTEYERKRLANIQRNLEFMKTMGVSTAKMAARTAVGRPKPVKVATKRVITVEQPVRKSRRLQGKEAQFELDMHASDARTDTAVLAIEPATEEDRRARFDPTKVGNALNVSSEHGQHLLGSMTAEEQESDLVVDATGMDGVSDYALVHNDIVKATHERIYSVAFHPRKDKVVVASGDKQGNLALWSADEEESEGKTSSVVMYRPHKAPVTQLCFNPGDASKLVSSSFDGSVREFDLKAAAFTELYGGDYGVTSMALDNTHHTYLLSCEDGSVVTLDQRAPKTKHSSYELHEKKINTVHHSPLQTNCITTASLDRTVCLWDLRRMKKTKSTPLATMPHHRSVNCAYFSPDGAHLVTVGQDNFLHIYDTRTTKYSDPENVAPTLAIPHNNQTGRWLTKLHASWDPKHPTRYVIGCMQQPRRLQIFDATRKNPVQELYSDLFNSVHSINVFHPKLNLIAGGNSSGRLCLWRPVRKYGRK